MIGAFAVVTKQLPDRHGVLVRHPNGAATFDSGDDSGSFVRVLARRAHPSGGSEIDLPQEGELGVAMELDDGHLVWFGSIHWQDANQIDPTPNLSMDRHTSGVTVQKRQNGDTQFDHPSGLRITVAAQEGALPAPKRKGSGWTPPKGPCVVEIAHPSGTTISISEGGAVRIEAVNLELDGMASLDGGLGITSGASGTFGTTTGQVVTVQDGIITSLY